MQNHEAQKYTSQKERSHYQLLFVLGAGHSGSTLLNLLLNAHTEVVGLCEILTIQTRLRLPLDDVRNPMQIGFWHEIAQCWYSKTGLPFMEIDLQTPNRRRLSQGDNTALDRFRDHNVTLFDCVAQVSGARVIVDTSKNRWRLVALDRCGVWDLKVVHLIRDGRALVNSYSRKYGSLRVGLRRWFVPTLMSLVLRTRIRASWLTVRYEDLARDPEKSLRRICGFVGLDYEEGMVRYWEHEDVSVGGNRMRWQKKPVRLDEKWRNQLTVRSRVTFALVGGWLNYICGYRPVAIGIKKAATSGDATTKESLESTRRKG